MFIAVANIARYDQQTANLLFDEIADEVKLRDSPDFFRALVALNPDQVFGEYKEMPNADERGTDYRIRIRNTIIPALAAKDDVEFWDRLTAQPFFDVHPQVLKQLRE